MTGDVFPEFCQGGLMPRQLRVEYEGAIYHVMNRGDRREAIFWDDADRLVAAPLRLGWAENELQPRRKGAKKKAELAAQLRQETTLSWAWIAKRLAMGHWRTAANAVRAQAAK